MCQHMPYDDRQVTLNMTFLFSRPSLVLRVDKLLNDLQSLYHFQKTPASVYKTLCKSYVGSVLFAPHSAVYCDSHVVLEHSF